MAGNDPVDTKRSSRLKDTLQRAHPLHRPSLSLFSLNRSPEPRVIYIIGGPSSGKTSIATMLAQNYPIVHLIPSEIAKQVQTAGSEEDKKLIKDKMNPNTGNIPDDVLCKLLRKAMEEPIQNGQRWFIVEFIPESLDQFKCFDKEFGHKMIIHVNTPSDEMEKRYMAQEMTFAEGTKAKETLDARRNHYFTSLINMQNDRTFPRMQWVNGDKPVLENIKELRPIMEALLRIKSRTKPQSTE